MEESFELTPEGVEFLAKYFTENSGLEFYSLVESETDDAKQLKIMLLLAFRHSPGDYDYSMYKEWSENILAGE